MHALLSDYFVGKSFSVHSVLPRDSTTRAADSFFIVYCFRFENLIYHINCETMDFPHIF